MRISSTSSRIGRAVAIVSLALAVGAAGAAGFGPAVAAELRALGEQEMDRVTAGLGRSFWAEREFPRAVPFPIRSRPESGEIGRLFERLIETRNAGIEPRSRSPRVFRPLSGTDLGSGRLFEILRQLSGTDLGSSR